ncbi:MAG: DNA primase, partial [Rhodospirillales bacterium]
MAFSPRFLDELRARVGLADVISRRVKLTRKGREHLGLCPFHKEKTPSFTVNEEKGFYHCFGCQAHGSAIDFVMNTEGLAFPEAVKRLAEEAGLEVPADTPEERRRDRQRQTLYEVMEKAVAFFENKLKSPEGAPARQYLKKRGVGEAFAGRFRLGFAPDSRGQIKDALAGQGIPEEQMVEAGLLIRPEDASRDTYDRFRGRLMFPIADRRGRPIAFGGRILDDQEAGRPEGPTGSATKAPKDLNSPETPLFHKGRVLYGLDQAQAPARKASSLIVTEGY